MNFIAISPQFPKTYWNFCDRLKSNGANVFGIGDTPYQELSEDLKASLTEYYWVGNMQNREEMLKAVGYFTYRYGKIDWIESNNEFWLESDAYLRSEFNINTGIKEAEIEAFKLKSAMKDFYHKGNIPCARYSMVSDLATAKKFIKQVGYPIIVKPDNGVGANATFKLRNEFELNQFYKNKPRIPYIMEEFISGTIYSYDAIVNSKKKVLFETVHCFPDPIMDIVNTNNHLKYYTVKNIEEDLLDLGRRTLKAFGVKSRFVHFEFFRLLEDRPGLAKKGELVALEVNMRPAGGYTPDMMNFANMCDVYQIYADMVCFDENRQPPIVRKFFCAYASKKDGKNYLHSDEQIKSRYFSNIMMDERMPDILAGAMGNKMFAARFYTIEEVNEFINYVQCIQGEESYEN